MNYLQLRPNQQYKKMMQKIIKKIIFGIVVTIMFGGFASVAFAVSAVTPLVVQFVPNPLFVKANFLPLDETSGVVTITNNSGATQSIATEAINVLDNNNFGSLLHLKIVGSSGTLFDNTLANFLSTAGEVSLGTIGNGESKSFTYTISFINSSDNTYQGKTLGFDVCVGFQGGQTHCGDTVIGGEGGTGDGGTGGTGGGGGTITGTGGGGGGNGPIVPTTLIIFNEKASQITSGVGLSTGTALITWDTNLLATSQVVYGPNTTTYLFNINTLPAFGYPSYTGEDTTKVIFHSMLLTGLTAGQTYVYRVVSRASPPTISYEHEFTVPFPSQNEGGVGGAVFGIGRAEPLAESAGEGGVLGASTGPSANGNASSSGDVLGDSGIASTSGGNNLAAAITSGWGGLISTCSLIALLILLIGYLIWRFILRPRYEKKGLLEEKIGEKFSAFFGLFSALAIVVAFVLGQYCPIPIFLIALLISLGLYVYYKREMV